MLLILIQQSTLTSHHLLNSTMLLTLIQQSPLTSHHLLNSTMLPILIQLTNHPLNLTLATLQLLLPTTPRNNQWDREYQQVSRYSYIIILKQKSVHNLLYTIIVYMHSNCINCMHNLIRALKCKPRRLTLIWSLGQIIAEEECQGRSLYELYSFPRVPVFKLNVVKVSACRYKSRA